MKLHKKLLGSLVIVSLILGLFGYSNLNMQVKADVKFDEVSTLKINRLNGKVEYIKDYSQDYILLMMGDLHCANTTSTLRVAEELMDEETSLKTVLLDMGTPKEELKEYEKNHSEITIASSEDYSDMFWPLIYKYYDDDLMEACKPLCILLDKNRNVIMVTLGAEARDELMSFWGGVSSDYINIPYKAECDQAEARKILQKVNLFRTGSNAWEWESNNTTKKYHEDLEPLKYDYDLEKAAIQRAKELVVKYSHIRPNGKSYATAYKNSKLIDGENIAYGFGTADAVFEGWKEEHEDYDGQGHRRNMLSDEYSSIGMACVTYKGVTFWVQEFSRDVINTTYTSPIEGTYDTEVELTSYFIRDMTFNIGSSISIYRGESYALGNGVRADVEVENCVFDSFNIPANFSWHIKNTDIARVTDGSTIVGLNKGTAYLYPNIRSFGYEVATPIKVYVYVDSDLKYLAMSELAYCNCSVSSGKTIAQSGRLADYIDRQAKGLGSVNSYIPHKQFRMTNKQFIQKLFGFISDWKIVDKYECASGFYAIALEKGDEHVLAIRGSQNIFNYKSFSTDWVNNAAYGLMNKASSQMKDAISKVKIDRNKAQGKRYLITGHSLGGGLATMVGNYTNEKSVAFDGSPTTDVSYYQMSNVMSETFRGVDTWKSVDYVNEHDAIGGFESGCKNYISLKNRNNSLSIMNAHCRWAIVDSDNGELEFSPEVSRHIFGSGSRFKKYLFMGTGTLFLGSNSSDSISSSSTGYNQKDVIYGGYGYDKLYTYGGDDTICGGLGDDTLDGGSGNDKYIYWKGQGTDTIVDNSGNDRVDLYGFNYGDRVTVSDTNDYKVVKFNNDPILKIRKKRDMLNVTNSFVVNVLTSGGGKISSSKIQDWNNWKNSREFTIACPTKVQIFDKDGNMVQELDNELDEPIYTDYGQFYVDNEDGELIKHVVLEEGYRIRIIATDDGAMDFYSNEDDGMTIKNEYAENINLSKNDVFEVKDNDGKVELIGSEGTVSLKSKTIIRASEIRILKKDIALSVGKTEGLKATLYPSNSNEKLKYISSNPEIASVDDNGYVKGIAQGECDIGIYSTNGLVANVHIKVGDGKNAQKVSKPPKTTITKLKAKKKALKIFWKKAYGVKGYKIQYSIKKNFKGYKIKVIKKPSTTKVTLKKLKRKKKYYVRIRTFKVVNGKTYQSAWSKVKAKKTK